MKDNPEKAVSIVTLCKVLNVAFPSSLHCEITELGLLIVSKHTKKKVWINETFRIVGEAG